MEENNFYKIFGRYWDMIIVSIIAAICFQVMSLGQNISQKTIFTFFTAFILTSIYSTYEWTSKLEKNKRFPIRILVTLFIILSIPIIKIIIIILVWTTN